jgi:FeS assembly SUF system protein
METQKRLVGLGTSKLPGHANESTTESKSSEPAPDPSGTLEERVIAAIKTCYDPELPVNIHELGLIYDLKVEPSGAVSIRMTLTSPGCPVAGSLVQDVQSKVQAVAGVTSAKVELVWEPPWDRSRMSEAAQLELGFF